MTRRLPWWSAHVAGLIVCQAAFWYGYWELADGRSFPDAVREATTVPIGGMVVLWIFTVPVWALVCGLIFFTARRPWRWVLTFAAYFLAAGYWAFVASAMATMDDL